MPDWLRHINLSCCCMKLLITPKIYANRKQPFFCCRILSIYRSAQKKHNNYNTIFHSNRWLCFQMYNTCRQIIMLSRQDAKTLRFTTALRLFAYSCFCSLIPIIPLLNAQLNRLCLLNGNSKKLPLILLYYTRLISAPRACNRLSIYW